MISVASSQVARTSPPLPRVVTYEPRRIGSFWIASQAWIGVFVLRISRQTFIRRPRTSGFFTRLAEYRYHE